MQRLIKGIAVSDNDQVNGLRHDAAGRLGLADTKLTGIDTRCRVNQDMPCQRDLPPGQQKDQRNAACPLSKTHALILHQAKSRCAGQNMLKLHWVESGKRLHLVSGYAYITRWKLL